MRSLAGLDMDSISAFDLQSLLSDFPSLSSLSVNMTELLAPGKEWLSGKTTSFAVGRESVERGQQKKHAVIIIPGISESGHFDGTSTRVTRSNDVLVQSLAYVTVPLVLLDMYRGNRWFTIRLDPTAHVYIGPCRGSSHGQRRPTARPSSGNESGPARP